MGGMNTIKKLVRELNHIIASIILFVFYLLILPLGKILFLIHSIFGRKDTKTYWQEPDEQKRDLSSPY